MPDLADHVAATTAGYKRIQIDRGAGSSPRYSSTYEKQLVGEPGASGSMFRATGTSDVSQAAADSQALSALNGQRRHRYAGPGSYAGSAPFNYTSGQPVADFSYRRRELTRPLYQQRKTPEWPSTPTRTSTASSESWRR
jgi:hypothetical protein